jgi:hypothetical protein
MPCAGRSAVAIHAAWKVRFRFLRQSDWNAMKHLQTLRELSGFAMLAVIGVAALWLCRLVVANAFAFVLFFVPAMVAGALLVVGIIGMIWSVGDWLLSALKARYHNKKI